MRNSSSVASTVCLALLLIIGFGDFVAQNVSQVREPSPSPSASPSVLPTPSPSSSPLSSPSPSPSPTPLPGAQNFHQWGSITIFNGLPSDSVRAIAQTPDGIIWFGTDNGLARFDGRRVQTILLGDSEPDRVLGLALAETGELWVGTDSGAYVLMAGKFVPVEGTRGIGITSILVVRGDAFLGTATGLVLKVPAGGQAAVQIVEGPLTGEDGALLSVGCLVWSQDRLLACTLGKGVVEIGGTAVKELITSPRPTFVRSLMQDRHRELWFGTSAAKGASGVYISDSNSKVTRIPAPTADVFTLATNSGSVWAGTERYGLFQFAGTILKKNYTFENTSGGLRSNTIFALFTDREGVLWIGTNRGVSRFDTDGASQETISDIPNSNFVRTIYQAPGEEGLLYAGTNRGLFVKSHPRTLRDNWTPVPAFVNKVVYAIRQRYESSLVVGTSDGLFDLSGRKILDGDVRSLAGFNVRDYAAVLGKGVFDVTDPVAKLVIPNDQVISFGQRWNRLWIGTLDGNLLSYDGHTVSTEASADKLRSGTIWNLSQLDPDGPLYIAGQHGIFRILKGGTVEPVIAVEDARDVIERDEHIWAATTTRGLLHGRFDHRFGWLVSTIGFEQGLPSEKAFAIQSAGDWLIVATNRGVVTYKTGLIAPKLMPIRIISQRVHDLAEMASTIPLDYPQNSLLVEVAGQSSRTFPEEFQYAFVLTNSKGEEVDRRISNEQEYAPADLAPGGYTIESVAFNRDLLASEPLFIRFSVAKAPFPWTATALAVLLLLSLGGLVWAVVEHRRIAERNRELAAARLDLANEAERERRRIARDLHDQTLADLRNLMIASDKLVADNGAFRNEIEAVSTEIRRICEDLSPSVLENVGLVAALEFLLDRTVENRRFEADDSIDDRINFPMNVQLQIYRIAQEVLTNIVRHSDATKVEMNVDTSVPGEFRLSIRDNGRPFQPDGGTPTGRGVSNIRARANLINGRVVWEVSSSGGNVFSLSLDG